MEGVFTTSNFRASVAIAAFFGSVVWMRYGASEAEVEPFPIKEAEPASSNRARLVHTARATYARTDTWQSADLDLTIHTKAVHNPNQSAFADLTIRAKDIYLVGLQARHQHFVPVAADKAASAALFEHEYGPNVMQNGPLRTFASEDNGLDATLQDLDMTWRLRIGHVARRGRIPDFKR